MKYLYMIIVVFITMHSFAQMDIVLADSNWTNQESGTNDRLFEIFMKDAHHGMIAGERSLLKTINGGESWVLNDTLVKPFERIVDIFTRDNATFWMILEEDINMGKGSYAENVYHVMKSIDSTDTWNLLYTSEETYLSAIYFADSLNGWVAGSELTVLHTADGGLTWNEQQIDNSVMLLRDVFFINENDGFVIGSNATIFKTSDGGQNWERKAEDLPWSSLQCIYFQNETDGWIGGSNGMIYYTSDGGETWQYNQLGISDQIFDFYMKSNQLGWALSGNGRLFATSQGALNWHISDTLSNYNLLAVDFVDSDNGWIVGDNGLILHTNDADGGLGIMDHPVKISPLEIYPNPASDEVYIKSTSSAALNVQILLLDMNGRKVAQSQLNLKAGDHRKLWNISGLPAGIYSVKLSWQKNEEVLKLLKH